MTLRTGTDIRGDVASSLANVAHEAASATTSGPLGAALHAAVQSLLGADHVRLLEISQDGRGAGDEGQGADEYVRFGDGPSGTARVLSTGVAFAVPDALTSDAIVPGRAAHHGVASVLFVPVAWGGSVRKVLFVGWHTRRELPPETVELAQLLTDQAAAGYARLEADERRAAGSPQDRAVVRAARALGRSLDLQEILDALVEEAARALNADMSGVYLVDQEHGGAVATAGYNVPDSWVGVHIDRGQGAAGRVLESGQAFISTDYQLLSGKLEHPVVGDLLAAMSVPIAWDDELRGALKVAWTTRRHVQDEDLRTLEAIAGLAAVSCRNAEAFEHVQHVARTDALTGVLNHGAMQLRIREEIARARRDGHPLGAVILDLDDFKGVNDTQGHAAGDELLRKVARALQGELRPYDQVARYGGDEFVLLLPGSDEAVTAAVAERCRDAIGGKCSIGVAAWHDGLDAGGLLEQADRALMLAKRTGKGRVAVANPELERELALLQSHSGSPAAVQALAAAIEERDHYTQDHTQELVRLARGVSMMLGLDSVQVERIAHAALLHDVGKLAIPAEVLEKDGPLTREEWEVMSEHPIVGERILARTKELAMLAPIVRHEHEHWDGTGYPDGLERTRIPVGSRVILACHAWVAMTTERPYRPALTPAQAVDELRAGAGSKYDPDVIDALLDLLGDDKPQVPDRAAGVKLAAAPPKEPTSRRGRPQGWVPGG